MPEKFDAILIGTGQAAPSLAGRLTAAGMRIAVVERKLFGGTCVNTGCIPTKAMVASAYAAHTTRRSAEFGVVVSGDVTVDMKAVKARKDAIAAQSRTGVESSLKAMKNCTVIEGEARFTAPHEVRAGEQDLSAERIFINVGARAVMPAIPGLQEAGALNNSSMMDVDFLPEHLLVVGGSYIALEFAQMFRRFGSSVTVLERGPRLMSREDEDLSEGILQILRSEGIDIRLNTSCHAFSGRAGDVTALVATGAIQSSLKASHVLMAVGRTPNTDDLGLDAAGIASDEKGYIHVDDELRTSVEGIWALGDCNGKGAFTHTSYNDGEIVAANLLTNDKRYVSDRITAYGVFIDPPLGRAGMTEREARAAGRQLLIGKRPMTRVGRAVEKSETAGFIKILVDAESKLILGAAILGTGGDEAIHSILDVMYAKATYTVLQRAVHIHPTVSELLPTVLGELTAAP